MTILIRRYCVQLALDGWRQHARDDDHAVVWYETGQGIVYNLLRHANPSAAQQLHDANQRKPISITPITVQGYPNGIAQADFQIGVWDAALAEILDRALVGAADVPLTLGGRDALLVSWRHDPAIKASSFEEIEPPEVVRVQFVSPTFFGFGRHPNGRARIQLVPEPGAAVSSWLRAWRLTGARRFDWLPSSPEDLGQLVALVRILDLRTRVAMARTGRVIGFTGDCSYCWMGPEREGKLALATLARFATVCGTGAKTGRGFGQTRLVEHDGRSAGQEATG